MFWLKNGEKSCDEPATDTWLQRYRHTTDTLTITSFQRQFNRILRLKIVQFITTMNVRCKYLAIKTGFAKFNIKISWSNANWCDEQQKKTSYRWLWRLWPFFQVVYVHSQRFALAKTICKWLKWALNTWMTCNHAKHCAAVNNLNALSNQLPDVHDFVARCCLVLRV